MANAYRLSKRQGVTALRPTGQEIIVTSSNVARIDFAGVAINGVTNIYKWTLASGKYLLLDESGSLEITVSPAVQIEHEELGKIWYVDLALPQTTFNSSSVLWRELAIDITIYEGSNGSIDDTYSVGTRSTLLDGSKCLSIVP